MTDQKRITLRRLERLGAHREPWKVMEWLSQSDIQPIAAEPANVDLSEVERVWRVRLGISESKGHTIEGARDLLAALAVGNSKKKLQQMSFSSHEAMANVFFEKRTRKYVGWVLFAATPLREELRRAS
jgi:hypothetical protein